MLNRKESSWLPDVPAFGDCVSNVPVSRPLFDDAIEGMFLAIAEYENTLNSIDGILYGHEACKNPVGEQPMKVVDVIRYLTRGLEEQNKRLYAIRDDLERHFGQLKL